MHLTELIPCVYLFLIVGVIECINNSTSEASNKTTIQFSGNVSVATTAATIKNQQPPKDELKEIYDKLEFGQDMYVLPFVCTIGIAGNSLVATFLYERRGSNSSFIYMFALLVANTLSLVSDLFLPISKLIAMTNSNTVKEIAANLYFWNKNFITYILRGTAFNVLCVLSAERLMAIKYPLKLKTSLTVTKPQIFLLLSLLIATCTNLQIPLFTEIAAVTDSTTNQTSYLRVYTNLYFKDKNLSDQIVLFLHFFAGPVQIVFFCVMNVLIVHGMYLNRKNLMDMNVNNIDRLRSIKNLQVKLCKIFLALCMFNIFAFLPNSVTTIIAKMFPELGMNIRSYSTQILLHGGNFLRILNSVSDFIVMLAMSEEIRRDVKRKLKCFRSPNRYVDKETLSSSTNKRTSKTDVASISNGESFNGSRN